MEIKKAAGAIQNIAENSLSKAENSANQASQEVSKEVDSLESGRHTDSIFGQQFLPLSADSEKMNRMRSLISEFTGSAQENKSEQELAQVIAQELQKMGVEVDPDKLNDIVDAITKGGEGGMALALSLAMNIAEVRSEAIASAADTDSTGSDSRVIGDPVSPTKRKS